MIRMKGRINHLSKVLKSIVMILIDLLGIPFSEYVTNLGLNFPLNLVSVFSDLRDYRSNHNFNCVCLVCSCGIEDETSVHNKNTDNKIIRNLGPLIWILQSLQRQFLWVP